MSIAVILLAAGRSSRMEEGRHKLLLPLGNQPVVVHVVETILASQASSLVIVLGYQTAQLQSILSPYVTQPQVTLVENPDYAQGMSTSLHKGIATLITLPQQLEGAIIMLGDQPLMTSSIINTVIETYHTTHKRIITPYYNGKRGNPTFFAASLFPELLDMTGDEGGRKVIERHPNDVAKVALDDSTVNYDVDTWETYQEVVRMWKERQD
jgi:molybdenum cofactor cytidylyltransferase